jgi:hypothetical protein
LNAKGKVALDCFCRLSIIVPCRTHRAYS